MTISAIVLSAGEGTRMRSELPKPLHPICGRPMVLHCLYALEKLQPDNTVVVVGHGAEQVTSTIEATAPSWVNPRFAEQVEQHGTGHAAMIGLGALDDDVFDDEATVVIIPGDAPLLRAETLDELVANHVANSRAATLLTSVLDDPTGYGRVIRNKDGQVVRVVEQRDGTPEQLAITEVNTSIYAFRRDLLGPALRSLSTDNAQGELYLTDVVESLSALGHRVGAVEAPETETQGVNNRWQLALAERELRNRINRHWLLNGVTMFDPRQTFVDVDVKLGKDVTLYPSVMLRGNTTVGNDTRIGPNVELVDTNVGSHVTVSHSVAESSDIGDEANVGPFVHLPANTKVAPATTVASPFSTPDQ